MDIKNQVAPKGLEFRPASMVISDKFVTILTVVSYPKKTPLTAEEQAKVDDFKPLSEINKPKTLEELKEAGLDSHYAEHAKALFPTDSNGVPFTTTYFATTGDPLADIAEDMAAEQKARTTYDNILRLVKDPDVAEPIRFLRAREIVHFQRFGETNQSR